MGVGGIGGWVGGGGGGGGQLKIGKEPTSFIKSLLGASHPPRAKSDICSPVLKQRAEGL